VTCGLALAAVHQQRRADNLAAALQSSRRIGAATGIVMAMHRCPYDEAFEMLRNVSQRTHRKLRDVADEVLFTGALPDL
jgi:AmiR/NasT family two-component response regulator